MEHDTLDPDAPPRRLYRNPRNKLVAGVCGGLGRYFGIDPVIVRIAFVVLAMIGGSGILLYVIFWVVVPEWGDDSTMGERLVQRGPHRSKVGIVLLGAAALVVLHALFDGGLGMALTLMVVGGALLLWKRDDPHAFGRGGGGAGGVGRTAGGLDDDEEDDDAPFSSGYVRYARTPGDAAPRPRSYLGRLTVGVMLLTLGVIAVGSATDLFDIGLETALAAALLVTGLGLVVGAWVGRSRGLIFLGLLLTLLLAGASVVEVPLRGGVGERNYRPASLDELRDEYRLLAGELRIDLTDLDFPRGPTEIEASVAGGEIRVLVPRNVDVLVETSIQAGEALVLGTREDGVNIDSTVTGEAETEGPPAELVLRLEVGAGHVEVAREAA